jgi:hypothetical protein
VDTSSEHNEWQAFFLDTQTQTKPAETIEAGFRTGEKAGQGDKKEKD